MNEKRTKSNVIDNRLELLAIFLLGITGVPALIYGWKLMRDVYGTSAGFRVEILESTPFEDFFYPGLILFVAIGVLSIAAGVLTFFEAKNYRRIVLMQGFLLVGWLTAEVQFGLYESNIHLPYYGIGFFIIVLGILMLIKKARIERVG